jgi:hypothetical protein
MCLGPAAGVVWRKGQLEESEVGEGAWRNDVSQKYGGGKPLVWVAVGREWFILLSALPRY